MQFNDAHQILEDLETTTTIYRAYRVLNGEMVERSNNFVPAGVSGCVYDCVNTYCLYGVNYTDPSPWADEVPQLRLHATWRRGLQVDERLRVLMGWHVRKLLLES